jgi:histidinol-phosphatase (PHP family)
MKDEDYVKEYIEEGFEKIAFTDHCPWGKEIETRTNARMLLSEKEEYLDSIKKLKEKYAGKIEIQSGFEVEYLPGKEKDLIELKKETDKIVLGQHMVYDDNDNIKYTHGGEKYTDTELIKYAEYIVKGMEYNIPDIIAHPDLFTYVREGFGELEAKISNMICEAAEKYNVVLELNLHDIFKKVYQKNVKEKNLSMDKKRERIKDVQYPCKNFWKIATNYDIKVAFGLDIHYGGEISLMNEFVQFANEILGEEITSELNFAEEL